MKVCELHLIESDNNFDAQNSLDHQAAPIKISSMYDKHDFGKNVKTSTVKVLVKNTKTGKVYGARTIVQRDI